MKQFLLFIVLVLLAGGIYAQKQNYPSKPGPTGVTIDTRIDNMDGYWMSLVKMGVVPANPDVKAAPAVYTGSKIEAFSVVKDDSPDVQLTTVNSTQSENSVFVDPNNIEALLQSNNSTQNPVGSLYGANYFLSSDAGLTWGGSVQGAGGSNSGDPTTAIDLDGTMYVNFIHNNYGQGCAHSTDGGLTWTSVVAAPNPGSMADKNHMWIDNSVSSPYEGSLYIAYTAFGGGNDSEILIHKSAGGGVNWSSGINISSAVNAGSHNQGVNIQTGPNGEVYACWAIYDGWPTNETSIGFAKSTNGGTSYAPATRIISNIKGIRNVSIGKNMRKNSFPVMAVDISGGSQDGWIYIVWANNGVPGVNSGSDVDVYMIRSEDGGTTWTAPIRINQDPIGAGKKHYFPWISCDPETGTLSVIFYDDRNVGGAQVEVFCANSFDGGDTWEDFKVSDIAFTPSPIPGLADSYFGDYIGIIARGSKVYPVWTDNRIGHAMTFISPYETNNLAKPTNLVANINQSNGQVDLSWQFAGAPNFQYFNIYRDNVLLSTTTSQTYTDNLPAYGIFKYKVTAFHLEGESSPAQVTVQWGNAQIAVNPTSISQALDPGQTGSQTLTISNVGELELEYAISPVINNKDSKDYCASSGGCDEYISNVEVGTINNATACTQYGDYTALSTDMNTGETYPITVTNGNPIWSADECGIWIDWNQDEDFDDAGESMTVNGSPGVGPYTANIIPPSTALAGQTRMRVKIDYANTPDPCGTTTYGETEDYTVNLNNWLIVSPLLGTLQAGQNASINLAFDATTLSQGVYTADLNITSNDPDNGLVVVPVTLAVGPNMLNVTVTATPSSICTGESSQLNAAALGGTGTYTYSWTSNPPGFTSNLQNPVVYPTVTTVYFVSVNDGVNTVTDDVTVTVSAVPGVPGTPSGLDELCQDSPNTTYSTTGAINATSYNWYISPSTAGSVSGNGTTGIVNWDAAFSGVASITVKGANLCGEGLASTGIQVTVHPFPTVTFVLADTVCMNTPPFELTGGSPAGGTYTGTGVSTGWFYPQSAGVGTHEITYTYTDTYGCTSSETQEITVDFCTGIYESVNGMQVEIFPNPSKGDLTIRLTAEKEENLNLRIINSLGVTVFAENNIDVNSTYTNRVNVSNLSEGIYFIQLMNGTDTYVKKIIVKK